MDEIMVQGKKYPVVIPEDPSVDFIFFLEHYNKMRQLPDKLDFLEVLEEFGAYLFIKYNRDLFVRMMSEEALRLHGENLRNWFNRILP